jgi:CheY-like chemotaxis protein
MWRAAANRSAASRVVIANVATGKTTMRQTPMTVLVADDSLPICQLFRNALAGQQAEVIHATDGARCLATLDRGVDVAFIDVNMPDMNGSEVLWAARAAGNKTFVTLMTGRSSQRAIDLARQLDAYELLIKPFRHGDIAAILHSWRRIAAPLRVLLVDDSPVFLKIMRKVLTRSIFRLEIEEASEGTRALAGCLAAEFDVVFLDMNMPGLNGLETLARLMRTRRIAKVVMISSEQNALREREALRLGASAILHKPFFPIEIDEVLHTLFGLHSPRLARSRQIADFDIKIHGRTIAVVHGATGHCFQYVWFPDPPHLRMPRLVENEEAEIPARMLRHSAEKVARLELRNALRAP